VAGKIVCPECGATLSYRDQDIGKRAKCAGCGAVIVVDPIASVGSDEVSAVPATLRTVRIATRDSRVTNSVATASLLFALAGVVLLGAWLLADNFKLSSSQHLWIVLSCGFFAGLAVCLWILSVLMGLVSMARVKLSGGTEKGRGVAFFGVILGLLCMLTLAAYYYSKEVGGPRQALSRVVERMGLSTTDGGDAS